MELIESKTKYSNLLFWYYACYVVGVAILFPLASPGLNPDLVAYLSIAEKYAALQFPEAFNAYWSPLYSLCLAPFLALSVPPLIAVQLVNGISGFLVVYGMDKFILPTFGLRIAGAALRLLVVALTLAYQFMAQTPDLLFCAMLLFYFHAFFFQVNGGFRSVLRLFGILLLCFLAKNYFLAFGLAHLILFSFGYYFLLGEKKYLVRLAKVLPLFLFFLLMWSFALYVKYDRWILSSAAAYNQSVYTPHGDTLQYSSYAGLVKPVGEKAVFHWDDPTYYHIQSKSFPDLLSRIRYQWGIVAYNFPLLRYWFSFISYFSWLIIPLFVVFLFLEKEKKSIGAFLFFSGLLFVSGFMLLFIKEKYLLCPHYLLLFVFFYWADRLLRPLSWNTMVYFIFLGVALFAWMKNPVHQLMQTRKVFEIEKIQLEAAERLAAQAFLKNSTFACPTSPSGLYNFMPYTAFLSKAKFYGELSLFQTPEQHAVQLQQLGIKYLFWFGCAQVDIDGNCINQQLPVYLQGRKVVYEDPMVGLKIVALK